MYLLLLPLLLAAIDADTFTGKVIAVIDGDSIVVARDNKQIEIRLLEIDCPEFDQAFGPRAKKRTSELCLGKTVTVKATGKDDYDRTLSHVILPNGKELNRELVNAGLAWWYRKYSKDKSLGKLEANAKRDRRGLWSDKESIAPWDWRAAKRAESDVPISKIKVVPNGIKIVALLPNPKGVDAGREQVTIANSTNEPLNLRGWKLVDRANNEFALAGKVAAKKSLVVTMTESTMPLNNNGDEVLLLDAKKVVRSQVWYTADQVRSGVTLLAEVLGLRIEYRRSKERKKKSYPRIRLRRMPAKFDRENASQFATNV